MSKESKGRILVVGHNPAVERAVQAVCGKTYEYSLVDHREYAALKAQRELSMFAVAVIFNPTNGKVTLEKSYPDGHPTTVPLSVDALYALGYNIEQVINTQQPPLR
ncbi:MAG TPA: hypothetical protein VF209_01210 [Patescibacteria group bacterium]